MVSPCAGREEDKEWPFDISQLHTLSGSMLSKGIWSQCVWHLAGVQRLQAHGAEGVSPLSFLHDHIMTLSGSCTCGQICPSPVPVVLWHSAQSCPWPHFPICTPCSDPTTSLGHCSLPFIPGAAFPVSAAPHFSPLLNPGAGRRCISLAAACSRVIRISGCPLLWNCFLLRHLRIGSSIEMEIENHTQNCCSVCFPPPVIYYSISVFVCVFRVEPVSPAGHSSLQIPGF